MKKLIRDNIVYILFVLVIWAITFPLIFFWGDDIFARLNYFWSPPGYKPRHVENLLSKGDSYLSSDTTLSSGRIKKIFSSDQEPDLPPLDLRIMEEACDYFESRTHKDSFLDTPTWHSKKQMLGSYVEGDDRELALSFDPQIYWKYYSGNALSALDYYKRALNFSGPEIRVPRRIEKAARISCRLSEILLGYTTHIYSTESYIESEHLKDELARDDFLRKPSIFRRFWNWIRGRESRSREIPLYSKLSPKQIQLRIWDKIRSGGVREITQNEFLESLQKTLKNKGTNIQESSPLEALLIYERLLFFVSNKNSPLEYRRFRRERANIYLSLAKDNQEYYGLAISEFSDAREIPNPEYIPLEIFPAILVENFSLELGMARVYFREKKFQDCLRILNALETKLRNLDERSAGGPGLAIEKENLLKEYRQLKKTTLRKLERFEEADEIPSF